MRASKIKGFDKLSPNGGYLFSVSLSAIRARELAAN